MAQPHLGILMLDTRFPRVLGDVGNPESFDFPVAYRTVPGASPQAIVKGNPRHWIEAFTAAGKELVDQGCTGLATTCGFLSLVQAQIAAACGVPVAASALEQLALIAPRLPAGQTASVLTISASSLTAEHLEAAQVPAGTPIQGMDGTHFAQAILGNETTLDTTQAQAEMIAAAQTLCADHPNTGAIVLECTNMPPFAAAVAAATGRPTYSILSHLAWFHAGLAPANPYPSFG